MTLDLFLYPLESLFICMFQPCFPIIFDRAKPLRWHSHWGYDFCFQRGKHYKLCFTFISAWAVFSWENSFFAWQKWMWSIGENERPFLLQRKLPFAFAKKSKTYETKPQIFPCLQTLWKRDSSPVVRILSCTSLPISKNYGFNGKSQFIPVTPHYYNQNIMNVVIKHVEYIFHWM